MSTRKAASAASALDAPQGAPVAPRSVWAVGGGKGGIGKSFMAANLAASAARTGRHVLLVDADLNGANLHTCLGVRGTSPTNLSDYLEDRVVDLAKAAIDTPIPRVRLIAGSLNQTSATETTQPQREALLRALREVETDCVILDLAAGCDRSTLDFFLGADDGFVVSTPEPTSVENAYAFLRGAFFRLLARELASSPVRDQVREAVERRHDRGIRTPSDLLDEVERIDRSEGERVRCAVMDYRPRLVVNQVRAPDEVKIGFSIRSVCRKYFGIDLEYVGYVVFDDCVWRSVKERRPLVLAYPHSDGALYIRRILKKILEA